MAKYSLLFSKLYNRDHN